MSDQTEVADSPISASEVGLGEQQSFINSILANRIPGEELTSLVTRLLVEAEVIPRSIGTTATSAEAGPLHPHLARLCPISEASPLRPLLESTQALSEASLPEILAEHFEDEETRMIVGNAITRAQIAYWSNFQYQRRAREKFGNDISLRGSPLAALLTDSLGDRGLVFVEFVPLNDSQVYWGLEKMSAVQRRELLDKITSERGSAEIIGSARLETSNKHSVTKRRLRRGEDGLQKKKGHAIGTGIVSNFAQYFIDDQDDRGQTIRQERAESLIHRIISTAVSGGTIIDRGLERGWDMDIINHLGQGLRLRLSQGRMEFTGFVDPPSYTRRREKKR